jgi:hypothetical protein
MNDTKQPVLVPRPETKKEDGGEATKRPKDHHLDEWSSGQRGGGKVPTDFGWKTNPKQWQEEHGVAQPKDRPKDD